MGGKSQLHISITAFQLSLHQVVCVTCYSNFVPWTYSHFQQEDQTFHQPSNSYTNPLANNYGGGSYRYQDGGSYSQHAPDSYNYQTQGSGGSYQQQTSYDPNYLTGDEPYTADQYPSQQYPSQQYPSDRVNMDPYSNHPLNHSTHSFSQSREGLLPPVKFTIMSMLCCSLLNIVNPCW